MNLQTVFDTAGLPPLPNNQSLRDYYAGLAEKNREKFDGIKMYSNWKNFNTEADIGRNERIAIRRAMEKVYSAIDLGSPILLETGFEELRRPNVQLVIMKEEGIDSPLSKGLIGENGSGSLLPPISYAIAHKRPDMVRALVKEGADPSLLDPFKDETPLMVAIGRNDYEMMKLLVLELGADIHVTAKGNINRGNMNFMRYTALQYAELLLIESDESSRAFDDRIVSLLRDETAKRVPVTKLELVRS